MPCIIVKRLQNRELKVKPLMQNIESLRIVFFCIIWEAFVQYYMVSTRTGKAGKMGRHFPIREKSGDFEQTGKAIEFQTNIICFLVIFK